MKTLSQLIFATAAATAVLAISSATAQRSAPDTAQATRAFDPKTVETIEGKILSIEKMAPPQSRGHGIHLTLQSSRETIAVHLGPSWYVEKQSLRLGANDVVTVTGWRTTIDGKPAIIAAEVKLGNDTLKLRDENGIPAWSRGRGRKP